MERSASGSAIDTGKYIGYESYPAPQSPAFLPMVTLFFENGHYVQLSLYKSGAGWHANGSNYRGANISKMYAWIYSGQLESYYNFRRLNPNLKADNPLTDVWNHGTFAHTGLTLQSFFREFREGKYNDDASADRMYFHCDSHGARLFGGRLIRIGDADFDPRYDETYARAVIARATLVKSEKNL